MKPLKNSAYEVTNNISGREIALDFDPAARIHLMNVMTDMYQYPGMAVLREYTTNALDAHVEAGVTDPIEVKLPSRWDSTLRIRDYGAGLDLEQVETVYTRYGASTKRDTNDQTGAFGLGCKSGLAYSNQFSVVSVKDGLKHRMTIHRDPDGASSVTVTSGDGEPTDDRSGVEIVIPTKRFDTFEDQARKLFRFWAEGTVLVNGEPPERVDGMWLTDTLVLTETGSNESFVVMGGVPYPIEFEKLAFKEKHSLVAFVPIGSVAPSYNRESLHMTPETKTTIAQVEAEFAAKVQTQVQREVDKAATAWEAIKTAQHWHTILPGHSRASEYRWRGRTMPTEHKIPETDTKNRLVVVPSDSYARRLKEHERERSVPIESWPHAIWVTGYDKDKFTPTQKKKLNAWAESQNLSGYKDYRRFVLTHDRPRQVMRWVDPKRVVKWETVNAIKLARSYNGRVSTGRIPGSYDVFVAGDLEESMEADSIDTSSELFYFVGNFRAASPYVKLVTERYPDCSVVLLYSNRVAKFERNFPAAREASSVILDLYNEWYAKLSKADRFTLKIAERSSAMSNLTYIDPDRVKDPKLRVSVRLAKRDVSKLLAKRQGFQRVLRHRLPDLDVSWTDPLDAYPLLDVGSYYGRKSFQTHADHAYLYINSAWETGLARPAKVKVNRLKENV